MKIEFCISLTISRNSKPSKTLSKQGVLTRASWYRRRRAVKSRDSAICQYCGEFNLDGHVDHILPLSKGGTDDLDNLAWACAECNKRKGTRVPPHQAEAKEINIWTEEKPAVVTVNVMSQQDNSPAPFELPVTMDQLCDVAKAVIESGDNLSRRSLCTERMIFSTKKHPDFIAAMDAAGLLHRRNRSISKLTESGLHLLTSVYELNGE